MSAIYVGYFVPAVEYRAFEIRMSPDAHLLESRAGTSGYKYIFRVGNYVREAQIDLRQRRLRADSGLIVWRQRHFKGSCPKRIDTPFQLTASNVKPRPLACVSKTMVDA